MAMATNSFRPPYAVIMWADDRYIYAELPMTDPALPPYIAKYALSEGGLAQALSALRVVREAPRPTASAPANYTIPKQPPIKTSKAHERLLSETTEEQRAKAREVLKKLGMK